MTFDVTADAYGRFMGRYSEPLATEFLAFAGIQPGQRVLDVGCGPGVLTERLVERLGAADVAAIDPSEPFVATTLERFPDADVRSGVAEHLPFADATFDAAVAQLVVHFMSDPVAGLREMARVTRPDGLVAACVWDHAGGSGPLSTFWRAVNDLESAAHDESGLPGTRRGHLAELFDAAGLREVERDVLTVQVGYDSFDDWWEPYTYGVGPAGSHVVALDHAARERLRARCAELLPSAPFEVRATAWSVRARS